MKTEETRMTILRQLQEKGVKIPCPETVDIGADISPDRISGDDVIIHAGCKIYGPETLVMQGVALGEEAPVTVQNCQMGRGVKLKGGYFSGSTFLENASMGSGAYIREACLLEEGARGAHTVGLKHTILLPFVTLGSLINFCDCLMAGGTDRKNHSEVGSSYIHFNYTANQDKATPSLIGDVARGVMINQPPIFLGGQGGLVGPVAVEYGTIVAAGCIIRKDFLKKNMILLGQPSLSKAMPFNPGLYANIRRIITRNTIYISNLITLRRWYLNIRSAFISGDEMEKALFEGAVHKLDLAIDERLKRLGEVADKMPRSIEIYRKIRGENISDKTVMIKQIFFERWQDMKQAFMESREMEGDLSKRDRFRAIIEKALAGFGKDYIRALKGLSGQESSVGVSWLQGLVDEINKRVWAYCGIKG